jgi:hypothetical protein
MVLLVFALAPADLHAQESASAADVFEDEASRELIMTYLRARAERNVPRDSYQALFRNRQRVGFLIPNQWFWRDRVLFHKEIASVMDFHPVDRRPPTLLAKTRGAPMIGDRVIDNPAWFGKFGFDPEKDSPALFGLLSFSLASLGRDLPYSGGPGRQLAGFDSTWVDPLSDDGLEHYVFRMGRVLDDPDPALRELRAVEMRSREEGSAELVGAIWFDMAGQPVRAMYRPKGRWKLRAGFKGFASAIPFVPRNALAEVDFITFEYGYDVPHRFVRTVLEGDMYWFYDQAILPVTMEWEADWDEYFESETIVRAFDEADGGITMRANGTWEAQPDSTFGAAWLAPPPIEAGSELMDFQQELHPFIRELDWIAGRPPQQGLGRTLGSAVAGVRFNQVQGVNITLRYPWYIGPRSTLNFAATIGTADEATGYAEYRREKKPHYWNLMAYVRLDDADWTENPNGFFSSLTAILTGYDDGNYYVAKGASASIGVNEHPVSGRAELFVERQSGVDKTETYSLFGPPDPPPPPPLEADEGTIGGLRGLVNFQLGDDPQKGVFVGRLFGTAAAGDFNYFSIGTANDLVGPLFWYIDGALRLTIGFARGEIPAQANWYLGGVKTVRGYAANSASGEVAYILRTEIGTSLPLLRLVLFADVGWASDPGDLLESDPLIGVGPGLSFFDGVVRIDFATGLNRNGAFRVSFATSGLF